MIIHRYAKACAIGESIKVKLPHPKLILDPRANYPRECRFTSKYHDDGMTVTLTRIDHDCRHARCQSIWMRVYDPETETVPRFDTTTYTYLGVDGERVPVDTVVGIIESSVKKIKENAFLNCRKMRKCVMHDKVHTIEMNAFQWCTSLEAIFLPPSLKSIGWRAFQYCFNMRILALPNNIAIRNIGGWIVVGNETFFDITQIQRYQMPEGITLSPDTIQVHRAIIDFYRNVPPLHKTCLNIYVSAQNIHDSIFTYGTAVTSIIDHDGMTPLHILAMNPHAESVAIVVCFEADMNSVFIKDSRGNSPLDYMEEYNFGGYTAVITSLCIHREVSMQNRNHFDG